MPDGTSTDALLRDKAAVNSRRNFQFLNHLPSDDVVQVKLSYLFR